MTAPPKGLLFDYGGTLVEEVRWDARAGIDVLLSHATNLPAGLTRETIYARADRITRDVANRRDEFQIETPWACLTRLIHDAFGTQFDAPLADLELPFWNAAVTTHAMPGVRDALRALAQAGIAMGVVSNASFGRHVIRHELAKHGLAEYFAVIVVSAEYAVRKPNPLLFEPAAALLGIAPRDIWFIGDRLDTDVAGARAAGMTPVWFAPDGDPARAGDAIHVRSWAALAARVL